MGILQEAWVQEAIAGADRAAAAGDDIGVTRALRALPPELYLLLFFDPLDDRFRNLKS